MRLDNRVEVLVLQHPQETRQAKGTVRLLERCLTRCRVIVGETFEPESLRQLLHSSDRRSVLVYPRSASDTVSEWHSESKDETPLQLVMLDATWRKSLKMLMSNPLLQVLPRMALQLDGKGLYGALRKARQPSQLSTLEATCLALENVELSPRRYAPVLAAFERFVEERLGLRPEPDGR